MPRPRKPSKDARNFINVAVSAGFLADGDVDEISSVLAWLPGARHLVLLIEPDIIGKPARPNGACLSSKVVEGAD